MTLRSLLILNGPGLDDLHPLAPSLDEAPTVARIEQACGRLCATYAIAMTFHQGNAVPELVDWMTRGAAAYDGFIINPGALYSSEFVEPWNSAIKILTHSKRPVIEVHLTNIFRPGGDRRVRLREPGANIGFICGLGLHSYLLAIEAIVRRAGR